MQARTIDTHIGRIVNEHLDLLCNRITTTPYPDTYRAMLSLPRLVTYSHFPV